MEKRRHRRSSGYNGLDLCFFEVTNAPYKNIKDNNVEAVKLDHCDQELLHFYTAILGSLALVISILSNVTIANYYDYGRTIIKLQSRGTVFMMFRLALKFGLRLVLRTDQRRKSRTPAYVYAHFWKNVNV